MIFNKDDEWEHVATMRACQEYCTGGKVIISPNQDKSNKQKILKDKDDKRKQWSEWANKVNDENKQ